MSQRFSDMSAQELRQHMASLNEQAKKAEQKGMINELAVLQRKIYMAKAYMLNPENYQPGETYELETEPENTFKILYMNGRFAWGYKNNGYKLQAYPISMLDKKVESESE